jgi:excinuclease ABC subunit A
VISEQSVDQILETIYTYKDNTKLMILAPIVRGRKGEHGKVWEDAKRGGFQRLRVDGKILTLDEPLKLDKQKKHTLEIVVDRLTVSRENRQRLAESVETALELAGGKLIVVRIEGDTQSEEFFSELHACPDCGVSIPELQPRLFSFNNPYGACPTCTGLGVIQEFDPDLVIPDKRLSFNRHRALQPEGELVPEPGRLGHQALRLQARHAAQ